MIKGIVVGQEGVIARLQGLPPGVRQQLRAAVRRETIHLVREAKIKVSGPVLKNRTGHLRAGINAQFDETATSVTGSAGINSGKAKYPAVHEFGGTFKVREHLRRMTQIFGRPMKTPRQVTVKAHTATYPVRSYLRSTLRENIGRINLALDEAVRKGVEA